MEIHALAREEKSYVHGTSSHPLLFATIGERIRLAANKFPNREFVLFKREGIRKTYKEVLDDVSFLGLGFICKKYLI